MANDKFTILTNGVIRAPIFMSSIIFQLNFKIQPYLRNATAFFSLDFSAESLEINKCVGAMSEYQDLHWSLTFLLL